MVTFGYYLLHLPKFFHDEEKYVALYFSLRTALKCVYETYSYRILQDQFTRSGKDQIQIYFSDFST